MYKKVRVGFVLVVLLLLGSCTTTKDYFETNNKQSEHIVYDHIYITVTNDKGTYQIELDTGKEVITYSTGVKLTDYEDFLSDFNDDILIYKAINQGQITQEDYDAHDFHLDGGKFQQRLKKYGNAFFKPITEYIEKTEKVIFVISDRLISQNLMLDLFIYNDQYFYLRKPVLYSFEKEYTGEPIYQDDWSLLSSSYRALDPKGATKSVSETFNNSIYRDDKDASDMVELLRADVGYDVILISAHGIVTENRLEGLYLGQNRLGPDHFLHSSSKITFLNACSLGVSKPFIDVMKDNGTNIYIAAVMYSTDGEPSDMLETEFFKYIQEGFSPSKALYETKVKLAKYYNEADDYTRLYFSFLYRLYYV